VLFDPASHEPLVETPWSESRARAAIGAIIADAESAFDEESLWPAHPLDEELTPAEALTLYIGASGVIWALDELERRGAVELRRNWAPTAAALHGRYVGGSLGDPTPSLLGGESGILLVAHRLAPSPLQEERLLLASGPTSQTRSGS
jgi:hypothetical protein